MAQQHTVKARHLLLPSIMPSCINTCRPQTQSILTQHSMASPTSFSAQLAFDQAPGNQQNHCTEHHVCVTPTSSHTLPLNYEDCRVSGRGGLMPHSV